MYVCWPYPILELRSQVSSPPAAGLVSAAEICWFECPVNICSPRSCICMNKSYNGWINKRSTWLTWVINGPSNRQTIRQRSPALQSYSKAGELALLQSLPIMWIGILLKLYCLRFYFNNLKQITGLKRRRRWAKTSDMGIFIYSAII